MIRYVLFSDHEAFKLREFMLRAEKFLPVKFDLMISAHDEGVFASGTPEAEKKEAMRYREGYDRVISELALEERCKITFLTGAPHFSETVLKAMEGHGPNDLICFLTTDEMLLSPVDEAAIEQAFEERDLFSFSLRLGKNIEENSMVGMKNKVLPSYEKGDVMVWDWDKHYVDFSGPLSVHGHYYRTKEVYRMVKNIQPVYSHDDLEEKLQAFMNFPKKLMASFIHSKAVSIDPLLHGNHRYDVHIAANTRLLAGDPVPIVPDESPKELHFNPFIPLMAELYKWQSQQILFKFPARGREEKFLSTLQTYYQNLRGPNFQFLISIDEDDEVLNTEKVKEAVAKFPKAKLVVGSSAGKIHAVNRDMEQADPWDIVVLVSDDMIPKVTGFDMLIRKDMNRHFPDTDGVLWYNDGHQGDKLNTLCILGKKYYDRFEHIYWPGYKSLYCDNDFMEVSKRLGKVHYNSLCIIEHQHWAWGYGEMDTLYQKNETYIKDDHDLFQKRLAENFGLTSATVDVQA